VPDGEVPASSVPAAGDERRLVTVLSADLEGSTPIGEQLDPEEYRTLQGLFFDAMRRVITPLGGTIEKYIGDEVLAMFGAPVAHEDDAERAVRCALAMHTAFGAVAMEAVRHWGVALRLRIGVNTGAVVSGAWDAGDRRDYAISGDTVTTAVRLQKATPPGQVYAGAGTMRLARRGIAFGPRQDLTLKGKARPVAAYAVLGVRPQPAERWEREELVGRLTPLVGRAHELASLRGYLAQVHQGHGRVVFVSGEAGIGKSRLLLELRRLVHAETNDEAANEEAANEEVAGHVTWLEAHCASYGKSIPYLPIVELLKRAFGVEEHDDPARIAARVEAATASWESAAQATVPYLKYLLGIDPGDPAVLAMEPLDRRAGVLDGLRAGLREASRRGPLIVVVEDLHWIDAPSEEALAALVEVIAGAPVLLVLTYRPGYASALGERSYYSRLALDPLLPAESAALASAVLGAEALPAPIRQLILDKAEGNPLFLEEVTLSLLEAGILRQHDGTYTLERPLEQVHIPHSIQEIILSRIDRLDRPAKGAIQLAAVIGREFARRLLERISDLESQLEAALHELKEIELIYEKSYFPELAYAFKHALIQDVAYSIVLIERRRGLHRLVAVAIEELYVDRLPEYYELLAHHYGEARVWPKALEYLLKAGDKAAAAYANQEALGYYAQALELCERLGDDTLESAMHAAQSRALVNFTVFHLADAVADLERLLPMARRRGDRVLEVRALAMSSYFHLYVYEYERAEACLREAVAVARAVDNADLIYLAENFLWALYNIFGRHEDAKAIMPRAERLIPASYGPFAVGTAVENVVEFRVWRGDFVGALEWVERWRAHVAEQHLVLGTPYLAVEWDECLALGGRGEYSRAITTLEQLIASCERVDEHTFYERALNTLGWIYAEVCDYEQATQWNARGLELARQLANPEVINNALINLGDCAMGRGLLDEAEAYYQEVERMVRAAAHEPTAEQQFGLWRYSQHFFHSYGELWLLRGDAAKALAYADECLALAEASGSRKNIVKGRRLRGQALLAQGHLAEAERELGTDLPVAREIGNPPQLWKTLAALGDLRQTQSKPTGARRAYRESLAVIDGVAAALTDEPLRQIFLGAAEVQRIRERAGPAPRRRLQQTMHAQPARRQAPADDA
jgi:class 3 adenylate cyclase/tetratricopeptide (TPR) repeat protein